MSVEEHLYLLPKRADAIPSPSFAELHLRQRAEQALTAATRGPLYYDTYVGPLTVHCVYAG